MVCDGEAAQLPPCAGSRARFGRPPLARRARRDVGARVAAGGFHESIKATYDSERFRRIRDEGVAIACDAARPSLVEPLPCQRFPQRCFNDLSLRMEGVENRLVPVAISNVDVELDARLPAGGEGEANGANWLSD